MFRYFYAALFGAAAVGGVMQCLPPSDQQVTIPISKTFNGNLTTDERAQAIKELTPIANQKLADIRAARLIEQAAELKYSARQPQP